MLIFMVVLARLSGINIAYDASVYLAIPFDYIAAVIINELIT